MVNTTVFSEASLAKIKRLIYAQATIQGKEWSFDQIQLAEDYIDALNKGAEPGTKYVLRPIGFESAYARRIRDAIRHQYRRPRA